RLQQTGNISYAADVIEKNGNVGGGCNPSRAGVHALDVDFVRLFTVLPGVGDFIRGALAHFVGGNFHIVDSAGGKDIVLNEVRVGLTAHLLDHAAQEAVSKI